MVAYTKPEHKKKEESEQLRGERDKIKCIDLRFERWQVVGLRKARRSLIGDPRRESSSPQRGKKVCDQSSQN